jgi:hypothetical protein
MIFGRLGFEEQLLHLIQLMKLKSVIICAANYTTSARSSSRLS